MNFLLLQKDLFKYFARSMYQKMKEKFINITNNDSQKIVELLLKKMIKLLNYCYLFFSDRPGLKGQTEITRLSQAVIRALRSELDRNHVLPIKGDVTVCDALLAKIPQLREISLLHMDALAKFKRSQPHLEFPALHKELFSVDS